MVPSGLQGWAGVQNSLNTCRLLPQAGDPRAWGQNSALFAEGDMEIVCYQLSAEGEEVTKGEQKNFIKETT